MKKPAFFSLLGMTLFLMACGTPSNTSAPEVISSETTLQTGTLRQGSYAYTRQMAKPNVSEITNRTAMNEGFHEQRTQNYTLDENTVDLFKRECLPYSEKKVLTLRSQGSGQQNQVEIPADQVKA
jgi:hypothetical protein